jgi:hypothetical protein
MADLRVALEAKSGSGERCGELFAWTGAADPAVAGSAPQTASTETNLGWKSIIMYKLFIQYFFICLLSDSNAEN